MRLDKSFEAMSYFDQQEKKFYGKVYEASIKHPKRIHLSGIPVALAKIGSDTALLGTLFVEHAYKGTVNVLGAPFHSKCHFGRGVRNLAFDLPVTVLYIPLTLLVKVIEVPYIIVKMTLTPAAFAYEKSTGLTYNKERIARENAVKAEENLFEKHLKACHDEEPNAHFVLGMDYILGRGTTKDISLAFENLHKAALHDDSIEAQEYLGETYLKGIDVPCDRNIAYYYLAMASKKGSIRGSEIIASNLQEQEQSFVEWERFKLYGIKLFLEEGLEEALEHFEMGDDYGMMAKFYILAMLKDNNDELHALQITAIEAEVASKRAQPLLDEALEALE